MLEGSKLAKAVNTSSNDPPSSSVKFKNNEPNVILTAEEAFYLVLHQYLLVNDANSVSLSLEDLWKRFTSKDSNFAHKYKCFEFFRKQNYVVRPGLHYGSDYTVYKASPQVCHSELCVTVVPCINGKDEVQPNNEQNWRHLSTLTRVMPDVMKLAMLCYVLPKSWEKKTSQTVSTVESNLNSDTVEDNAEKQDATESLVAPDTDLQMFLQFVEALIDENNESENVGGTEVAPTTADSRTGERDALSELHRNNSLFLHDIHSTTGNSDHTTTVTPADDATGGKMAAPHSDVNEGTAVNSLAPQAEITESAVPTVSPYLDLLFGSCSSSTNSTSSSSGTDSGTTIDLSSHHCLEQLTVRPVTILIRRMHADANKYMTVGQMQEKYAAKSIKKVPKRLLEIGNINNNNCSGGGSGKKRKRKRRDIGEVRSKSMSKTNQLWKELIVSAAPATEGEVASAAAAAAIADGDDAQTESEE